MELDTKRVLCVDDDLATLKVRKFLLEAAGYTVVTASSGAEALRMLTEDTDVDLVLLDYLMPGMNGDELAGRLRELYPNLRLIAVSAVGQLPQAFLDRVDSYVQKGQDPEVLLSVITAVLARPAGPPKSQRSPTPATILCVEDELLQLQLRKAQFESAGFHVLLGRSASAAMEIFRTQHVDAVVMDYWLSGSNGTSVAEEMKRLRPRIPVVMLSGFSPLPGEGVVVDAWLRKAAVEPEEVVNTVRQLISLRSDTQRDDPNHRPVPE
jgi:CheY-like chemotaxis protein